MNESEATTTLVTSDQSISGKLTAISVEAKERVQYHEDTGTSVSKMMLAYIENGIRIGWLLADAKMILRGSSETFDIWCDREIDASRSFCFKMMRIGSLFRRDREDYDRRIKSGIAHESDLNWQRLKDGNGDENTEQWDEVPALMQQIQDSKCGTFREILVAAGLMPARQVSITSGALETGFTKLWGFLLNSQQRLAKLLESDIEDVDQWNENDRRATLEKLEPFVRLYDKLKPKQLPSHAHAARIPNV